MKKNIKHIWMIAVLAIGFTACDENEAAPSYSKLGTATATMATIAASKASPAPSEAITVTLNYVNPSADPLTEIVLKAKVGTGEYAEVQKFNVQSEQHDVWLSKTVNYQVPASLGTVTLDMVISSQKAFPQVKRTSVTVK